jgi:hypothetical protein
VIGNAAGRLAYDKARKLFNDSSDD